VVVVCPKVAELRTARRHKRIDGKPRDNFIAEKI
jgi:hypothetical protein